MYESCYKGSLGDNLVWGCLKLNNRIKRSNIEMYVTQISHKVYHVLLYSCIETLEGYTGDELFSMGRKEMDRLLGKDEGHTLDSMLTVQKKISNVCLHLCLQ